MFAGSRNREVAEVVTPTPTLSTARLVLKPLLKATHRQLEWLRDPDVVRYSEQRHHKHSLSSQLTYIKSFGGRSHIWAICLFDSGEHIGNLTATCDEPNDVADVGIMIGERDMWKHGYATEALRAACDWLLEKNYGGNIRKLHVGMMKSNLGMVKVAEKCGFKFEAEQPNQFAIDGGLMAALHFSRTR